MSATLTRDKVFLTVSSTVLALFLASVVASLVWPIDRSPAGTIPLVVGASVYFLLPAVALLLWGRTSWKTSPEHRTRFHRIVMIGLALPPAFFVAGAFQALFLVFHGR